MDKRPASPSRALSPGGKRQRPESRKVGIVSHSKTEGPDDGDYHIKLYVVDLDLQSSPRPCGGEVKEYPSVDPVVKFEFPNRYPLFAVCVLNRTVYLFEGSHCRVPTEISQTSARKFVLSEEDFALASTNHVHVVWGEKLKRIRPMHHRKGSPEAIPTPDGKYILVFGIVLNLDESSGEFELYNPSEDKWEKLPGLPISCFGEKTIYVRGYSFIGKSHFVMVTNEATCALDLDKKEWSMVDDPPFKMNGYFVAVKGRYALSGAGRGADIGNGQFLKREQWERVKYFEDFPLSTFPPDIYSTPGMPSILPLDPIVQGEGEAQDGEVCHTCILHPSLDYQKARLLIDFCHTDLSTCKTNVSKCVSFRIHNLDCHLRLKLITL